MKFAMRHMEKGRRVILGLDGMPYEMIQKMAQERVMPHMQSLIAGGGFSRLRSSIPPVSSVAWSSVITGENPGVHGIFGFTDLAPNSYTLTFPNFQSLKAPPFWERNPRERSIILNVPGTYPARPLNGVLVSGFVALSLEKATYPSTLLPYLKKIDYQIDADAEKAHQSLDLFVDELEKTLDGRTSLFKFLWEEEKWDNFMLIFTGTDRLGHFLWKAYLERDHKYREFFFNYFRKIDRLIGEVISRLNPQDKMILLSDHGFELLEKDVNINFLLEKEGFLKFEEGNPRSLKDIASQTRAFALDPARIYIHRKGRFPRGSVGEEDVEKVMEELVNLFEALELEGKKVFKGIYRKEEVYEGPYLPEAPDLVLLENNGFNLRARLGADALFTNPIFTGKHTWGNAFLLVKGDKGGKSIPPEPKVEDILGILGID